MTVSPEPYNHDDDAEFNQVIGGFHNTTYQPPTSDSSPYGPNPHIPAHSIPSQTVKPGLTRRGKTALTIGAAVLAGGGLITWQHHAETVAANELRAQELQIQQAKLALEQQKALDKANKDAAKAQTAAAKARQAKVDACVNDNKDLVGKELGQTLSRVIEDCQTQYPDTTGTGADMQEAASTSSTNNNGGDTLLVGAGALLIGGLWVGIRKATRPQPPPHQ
jgi:hypothetical protein